MAKSGQSDIRLIKLGLEDGDSHTRYSAIKALLASGVIDESITKKVAELLEDPYEFVRSEAIEYIARAGRFDRDIRGHIVKLARDSSRFVRQAAVAAIGEFDHPAEPEIQAVVEVTRDEDII